MAENKETIILDFQVETGDVINELEKTKKSIIGLKEEQNALNKAYKEGSITVDEYASETVRVEQVMKKETQTYSTLTKAVGAQTNSINALTAQNKKLRDERNNLDLTSSKGILRLAEINKQLDINTDKIKENVSTLEKQKINIGNYAGGIKDALGALQGGIPALKAFQTGQLGVNAALNANPIGAVIIALTALKELFGGNAVIADKLSFAMSALSKGFGFIIDTIVTTVTSFDKLKEAITNPIQFLKQLATGTFEAGKAGYEAAEAMDAFGVQTAKANQQIQLADIQIKSLEKSLKDRTKSEQERIAIANQLADLEIVNAKRREELAKQELANEELRLKGKTLSGDEEAKLIELQTQVFVEAEEVKVTEAQRTTRINILLDKEQKESSKDKTDSIIADIERQQEAEDKAYLARVQQVEKEKQLAIAELLGYEARTKAAQDYANTINVTSGIQAEQADELDAITLAAIDSGRKRVASGKEVGKQQQELNRLQQDSTKIFAESTAAGKAISATLATTNTFLGATEALKQKSTLPSPFDVIAKIANVAAIITTGLSAVNSITKAAGGGTFMTKGPQLLMVGDNPGGRERVTVEPISGKGKTVVGKNMIRLAGGGVVETQSATGPINQSFAFRSAMNNTPTVVASWKEATELNTRIQFKESLVTL